MSDSVQKYSASRMGSAPIGPLLLSCSVPMMISMLVQALYNIVDSIFVSRVNEAALSAVSLAFPIQNLMIAFAVGTAVGVNAYLSRCLGEGQPGRGQPRGDERPVLSVLRRHRLSGVRHFGRAGVHCVPDHRCPDHAVRCRLSFHLHVMVHGLFLQCMLEKLLVATGAVRSPWPAS